jgi:ParB-like chromosome segregation protein Spo0J
MLRAGLKLPPIEVARLGPNDQQIMDGMHRARAAKLAGHKVIEAVVIVK